MNFSPDSRFMRLCGSFVSLVRINLLWLLCSRRFHRRHGFRPDSVPGG